MFIMGAALGEMVLPLMISNLFQIDKLVFVFVSFSQDFVFYLAIKKEASVLLFSSPLIARFRSVVPFIDDDYDDDDDDDDDYDDDDDDVDEHDDDDDDDVDYHDVTDDVDFHGDDDDGDATL